MTKANATPHVRFERRGALGAIVLDRPKAINALTLDMVRAMSTQLRRWVDDDAVHVVSITGAGERGLCAGGDVVAVVRALAGSSAERAEARNFFAEEYDLDGLIGGYPKPVVTVMDGVTMGGGVGIGAHAGLRLVTERSRVAMPETKIGFFPDVGGLHLLARAPGEFGTHLALTGAAVTGADAVFLGLADALVPSDAVESLLRDLESGVVAPPAELGATAHPAPLAQDQEWIDACYSGDDAALMLRRLRAYTGPGHERAHAAADDLAARSPFSVTVALAALRRAGRLGSLDAVLDQDRILAAAFANEPDFREGVRALLIDKGDTPRWRHSDLDAVPHTEVEAMFERT